MTSIFKVQGFRNHKYHDLWIGSNEHNALRMTKKSYIVKNYDPVRVIEIRSEQILIYRSGK